MENVTMVAPGQVYLGATATILKDQCTLRLMHRRAFFPRTETEHDGWFVVGLL